MTDKTKTIVIRGTLDWCKLLGNARPHTGEKRYDKGPYWSVDVTPDAKSRKLLMDLGLEDKFREPNAKNPKEHRKESYLALRVLENKPDGTKNKPVSIVNVRGEAWDDTEIGNGTAGDVKVRVVDYGKSVQKGVYLQAVRVLDLVPFEREAFAPLSEEDEYFAAPESGQEAQMSSSFGSDDNDDEDDVPY